MDWGVAFPQAHTPPFHDLEASEELHSTEEESETSQKNIMEKDHTCKFTKKELLTKTGACSELQE